MTGLGADWTGKSWPQAAGPLPMRNRIKADLAIEIIALLAPRPPSLRSAELRLGYLPWFQPNLLDLN